MKLSTMAGVKIYIEKPNEKTDFIMLCAIRRSMSGRMLKGFLRKE